MGPITQLLGNLGRAVADIGRDLVGDMAGVADADKGIIDLQLGTRVFNDVPAKMRTELWLSQLHRDKAIGAAAMEVYQSYLSQPLDSQLLADIAKDTHRTFPGHWKLSTRSGQRAMANVLRAYAASDPEIGYAQGMNFVVGLLLAYLDEEAEAFGALVLIMRGRNLREMYSHDMSLLQVRLWQLGRLMPTDVATHLESHAVLPVLYASSWFLTLFAGDFPMSFAARLMDLVIADGYAAPIMKVAVYIMERCRKELLAMEDMEDIVNHLRQTVPGWSRSTLHDLLTQALAKPWTPRQAAVLKEINGAESVIDAVARVDKERQEAASASEGTPSTSTSKRDNGGDATNASTTTTTTSAKPPLPPLSQPNKLPPPGSLRVERWRPTTPAMARVSSDSARIKPMMGDVALDPALSRQLWQYTNTTATTTTTANPPTATASPPATPTSPDLLDNDMVTITTPNTRHTQTQQTLSSTPETAVGNSLYTATSTEAQQQSSHVTTNSDNNGSSSGPSLSSIPASPFESALETMDSTLSTAANINNNQHTTSFNSNGTNSNNSNWTAGGGGGGLHSRGMSSEFGSFQQALDGDDGGGNAAAAGGVDDGTNGLADLLGVLDVGSTATATASSSYMGESGGGGGSQQQDPFALYQQLHSTGSSLDPRLSTLNSTSVLLGGGKGAAGKIATSEKK